MTRVRAFDRVGHGTFDQVEFDQVKFDQFRCGVRGPLADSGRRRGRWKRTPHTHTHTHTHLHEVLLTRQDQAEQGAPVLGDRKLFIYILLHYS